MKKNLIFFGKAVAFLVIFLLLMAPVQQIVARKSLSGTWDMTNKIGGFYNEPEGEFEVMFFGSSHAYAAFSPLRLWEDTGVKSYVFATQQQPLWATYTYLEEAFKTQNPALAVVECNMALDTQEYYDEGVTYSYMDDLPLTWNKAKLAWVSAPDVSGRVELLCNFIKYHSRWSDLHRWDLGYDRKSLRDPYKGYVFLEPQHTLRPRPAIEGVEGGGAILEKNAYWLEQIIQLCADRGVPLWLVKSPSNLTPDKKEMLNTVEALAQDHGVPFTDFNEAYGEIGLTEEMFYDERHLDAHGAALFTDYFAAQLMERYPGLDTNPEDTNWAADAAGYEEKLGET